MDNPNIISMIAQELSFSEKSIKNTIELLDQENTVPFIARYRKEITGSLNEDDIRNIESRVLYLRNLIFRKNSVLKSIEQQGKLTKELKEKIEHAKKLQEVEDLYLPFKPKRRTRATIAKEKGLQPLADIIIKQEMLSGNPMEIVSQYLNIEKGVETPEQAVSGARDIVAEIVSETAEIRQELRRLFFKTGYLCAESKNEEALVKYEIYKEFSEPIRTIPPHRVLAINRGEKENFLKAWIEIDDKMIISHINDYIIINRSSIFTDELLKAIEDSFKRLIYPSIERDIRKELKQKADAHATNIFSKNLRSLLLTPPCRDRIIMGIDPGYRTGCKVAVIDQTGKYLEGGVIYPHAPQNKWNEALTILKSFTEKFKVDIIAIGNGTASRETEQLAAQLISQTEREIHYAIVNEAGASVYSASKVAKQEFPDLEASMRGNISIARRLLDPLAELVKINPQSIGVGLYQHDVNQTELEKALDNVVESCVNLVGVDLNTASASLLKYTAGINVRVAEKIVKYRDENGKFSTRSDLKNITGLGENGFVQAAGFLRIPDAENFLDSTAVHPESYKAAIKLMEYLELSLESVKQYSSVVSKKIKNKNVSYPDLAKICSCGEETLLDIILSFEKPDRDPRDSMDKPLLRSDVLSMDDLNEGMILKGTVRNVVDFGAFVDIGVKQDGLVHTSNLSDRFVKNPLDVVSVGDIIEVEILSIDRHRGRIGLKRITG